MSEPAEGRIGHENSLNAPISASRVLGSVCSEHWNESIRRSEWLPGAERLIIVDSFYVNTAHLARSGGLRTSTIHGAVCAKSKQRRVLIALINHLNRFYSEFIACNRSRSVSEHPRRTVFAKQNATALMQHSLAIPGKLAVCSAGYTCSRKAFWNASSWFDPPTVNHRWWSPSWILHRHL